MFDSEIEEGLPPGIDTLPPGPLLAALLASVDVTERSGHDRVTVLKAHRRMASHYQAETYRDMVAITGAYEDLDELAQHPLAAPEVASGEIQAALRMTRHAADSELAFALELKERLPKLWNRFSAGDLDLARVRIVAAALSHLSEASARWLLDRVLDEAPELTTGRLRARIRALCIESDPEDARRRYERTVAQRRVVSYPTTSGTTNLLGSDLPPERVAAAMERINRIARSLTGPEESRRMDQLRADVLLDLLEGKNQAANAPRGVVDICVDLQTLTELNDAAAELAGYGPVIADIARQVTRQRRSAQWRFTVGDAATGNVYTGTTRRRPSAAERRNVEATYRTCVFPGCRMPASGCDLDHRIPYSQGGPTDERHLAPCCRRHHLIRHHGWTYGRLHNGDHEWTSPLGHVHASRSPPTARPGLSRSTP